jgi:hypothetical protein
MDNKDRIEELTTIQSEWLLLRSGVIPFEKWLDHMVQWAKRQKGNNADKHHAGNLKSE